MIVLWLMILFTGLGSANVTINYKFPSIYHAHDCKDRKCAVLSFFF